MNHREEVRAFPATRRAQITPAQAGLPAFNGAPPDLIGELSTRSVDCRSRWATHNVRFHRAGTKRYTRSAQALAFLASWAGTQSRPARSPSQERR